MQEIVSGLCGGTRIKETRNGVELSGIDLYLVLTEMYGQFHI